MGASEQHIVRPEDAPVAPVGTMIDPHALDGLLGDGAQAGGYGGFPLEADTSPEAHRDPDTNPFGVENPPPTISPNLNVSAEVYTSAQRGDTVSRHDISDEAPEDPMEAEPTRIESSVPGLDHGPGAALDQPKLVIIGGNDRGKEFPLLDGDNGIGRGLDNVIVLADIAVSRKHTLICKEEGAFVVRDLGSGNGTLVNGASVQVHRLQDGDQIELGNTLLRFSIPITALAEAPTMIGKLPAGAAPPPNAPLPEPEAYEPATAQHAATHAPSKGLSRRQRLLIFGGATVVLLLLAAAGVKIALKKKKPPPAPKASASVEAAKHFDKGMGYFRARKWQLARDRCLKVYALAPDFEDAKSCAQRALAEKRAQDALEQAQKDLKAKSYEAARTQLAKIPASSVYNKDVRRLKQQADDEEIESLIASAKKYKEAGDTAAAISKLKEARKVSPTNQVVKAMLAELSKDDAPKTPSRVVALKRPASKAHTPRQPRAPRQPKAPRSPRVPVGASARKAVALYGSGNFSAATQLLGGQAAKVSGSRRAKLSKLATAMKKAGQAITEARRTAGGNNTALALKYYGIALKYDAQVPATPLRNKLRGEAAKVARLHAASALNQGKWASAYRAVNEARRYGAPSAALQPILARLEKKATELFDKGYTLQKSNPKQAKKLWNQVLYMVPPSSKAYKDAYKWLNSSGSGYQDEDED